MKPMSELIRWMQSGALHHASLQLSGGAAAVFGFGGRATTLDEIKRCYPELSWAHVKQTHSAKAIEIKQPGDDVQGEADAMFTSTPGIGLYVKTADCLPVLIAWSGGVAAIHAGWRGVATEIVPKTIQAILQGNSGSAIARTSHLHFIVGPHIQKASFEVRGDSEILLRQAAERAEPEADWRTLSSPHPTDPQKSFVDLQAIVRLQIASAIEKHAVGSVASSVASNANKQPRTGIKSSIVVSPIDTLTSVEWSSYRRDGAGAGRNLSFIALKLEK